MDDKTVDIFMPITVGNMDRLAAAVYSALTQTYENIRVVLFLDQIHEDLEKFLVKWWYHHDEVPGANAQSVPYRHAPKPLTIEHCRRGVIVRNPNGPMGSAGFARQWVFEWEDGAPYMKFLDSDDILGPMAIEMMMPYMTPECAGVLCPMYFISAMRFGHIKSGAFEMGHIGSGSFLLKRETMKAIVDDGYQWVRQSGHDHSFITYCVEKKYPFVSMDPVRHNFVYMYLKS